jgi:hypothetical protein
MPSESKGDWEIKDVRIVHARTRSRLAMAVVAVGLGVLVVGVGYAIFSRDTATVRWIVGMVASMVGMVLVYYFRRRKCERNHTSAN